MSETAQGRRKLAVHRKDERHLQWGTITVIGFIHLGALLALRPELYSTSGLVLLVALYLMSGMLGVTLCYHRLLTHRGFQTHKWVEYFLTFCACQALQSGPIAWTALHRIHHKEADDEPDPHSPLVSFLWAHMGWLFVDTPGASTYAEYSRFAKDLDRDPVQRFLDRYFLVLYALTAALVYAAGELWGGLGLSWLVWGVFLRTVLLWHATWLVNSATHLWGYRNYRTDEDSTNNWWVALLSFGEGWHNNHHADQRSARHGQRWFEIDITYGLIRLMGRLGLAWQIMEPRRSVVARRLDIMVDPEALRLADERSQPAGILHTQTDPTIPISVPAMASAAEAYAAAVRAAREAEEAVGEALRHAAEALRHRRQEAAERMDQQVRQMLEGAKDMAMAAIEKAKFAAAEAGEFASQAGALAAAAKDRAAESARHAAEQSRLLAQEAADAAHRAAEEIAVAFKGITRPVISSAI
ncbi:MAG: fatty acid desaturase [Nitrospinota bacterium]